MYVHKVPIHLETEDKFLFHLTLRQCVILGVGISLAYTSFFDVLTTLQATVGLLVGVLAALLVLSCAVALAFAKILTRGLEEWGMVLLVYAFQPHLYLWRFARPDAFERNDQREHERLVRLPESEEDIW